MSLLAVVLLWIITRRPAFLLYNDDLLWLAPLSLANSASWSDIFRFTFQRDTEIASPTLNFSLSTYFHLFGNTPFYLPFFQVTLHLGSAFFFFLTLKSLFGGQKRLAFFGSAFYLVGYPLFHVYVWPVATQHVWFAFFHFLILYLFLTDKKKSDSLLWILIPLASLGRTSFLFTLASLFWISYASGRSLRKLSFPIAASCWFPLLQAYDASWGAQVEYFIIKFPGPYKLLLLYRKLPYGWTIACALSVVSLSFFCRYLPRLQAHRRARILISAGIFIFLAIESIFYSEEIYYLLISFLKIAYPGISEFSKVATYRWQPMQLYVPDAWRIVYLIAGVVLPPLSFYFLMRRFGTVMALFFIPVVPSLYYLRSRGLGTFVSELDGTTYYYCSRYALFLIPFVLVTYCGLLDLALQRTRSRLALRLAVAVLCVGLGYHMVSIDFRLKRSALAETVDTFTSLYPATLAYVAPPKKEVSIWLNDDEVSLSLRVVTFAKNSRVDLPANADPVVAGATSASRLLFGKSFSHFRLAPSRKMADVVRCQFDWCDAHDKPLKPREGPGLLSRLMLAPGESEAEFFSAVQVSGWRGYVAKTHFVPKPTGLFVQKYLENSFAP